MSFELEVLNIVVTSGLAWTGFMWLTGVVVAVTGWVLVEA